MTEPPAQGVMTTHGFLTLEWGMAYADFIDEAAEMLCAHWDEAEAFNNILSFSPNHEIFKQAQKLGRFHILTVRDCGKLVGYFRLVIAPHTQDQTHLMAWDNIIYVLPEYRKYGLGMTLLREGVKKAKALGATIAFFREQYRENGGGYLKRLGFVPQEVVYAKVLT